MFTHTQALQYEAKPDAPDPDFARKMQEVLGGQVLWSDGGGALTLTVLLPDR